MKRLLPLACLLVVTGFLTSDAKAQFFGEGMNDPFFQYYGFYLPRQAAMAAQPRPQDSINAIAANRQYSAMTERASLYDPIQPFGTYDPESLFGGRGGVRSGSMATHGTNINGSGPSGYYNRTHTYFPNLRSGRNSAAASVPAYAPRRAAGRPGMPGNPISGMTPNPRAF